MDHEPGTGERTWRRFAHQLRPIPGGSRRDPGRIFIGTDDQNFFTGEHAKAALVRSWLREFGVQQYREAVEDELKQAERTLDTYEQELKSLENANENSEKRIRENKRDIDRLQSEIGENKREQEMKSQQILDQKKQSPCIRRAKCAISKKRN